MEAKPDLSGTPQRYVLCEKCRHQTVIKIEEPPGQIVLGCTYCGHVWAIKNYNAP